MGFGERIQREREMRGISLDEIAAATKIGARSLRALEEEDFGKLPGGIFNKGFVRAYARYLGIDEEQAVIDYLATAGESTKPSELNKRDASLEAERLKNLGPNWKPTTVHSGSWGDLSVPWGSLALLALLIVAAFCIWHYRHPAMIRYQQWQARRFHRVQELQSSLPASPVVPPSANPPSANAAVPPPANPVAEPAKTAGTAPASPAPVGATPAEQTATTPVEQPPSAAGEFVVVVQAREDSWLKITADGKPMMEGVLRASRKTAVHAKEKITVVAGNAGGIDLSFNGKPQAPLGTDKQIRTITFTQQGMQE